MNPITIYYIATKEKTIRHLKAYLESQGVQLIPYESVFLDKLEYLLILEPVKIKEEYYSISRAWKRKLMLSRGNVTLIVGGYAESEHSNFLSLLDLPTNFRNWLERVHNVASFPLEYAGTEQFNEDGVKHDLFSDPWDRMLPLRGIDIINQLKKFLDGHDKHNSVSNQLTRLRTAMVNMEVLEGDEKKETLKEVTHEWDYLYNRWQYYKELFKWLPFYEASKKMENFFEKDIREVIKAPFNDKSEQLNFPTIKHKIDELKQLIKIEIEDYVDIENSW